MASAKIPPLFRAGQRRAAALGGVGMGGSGMLHSPRGCCGGMQDAAELRGRHSPRRWELSPGLLSGREGNSETLLNSEVCWSLYLDAAPLLNLGFSSLIQELFQSPSREKHGVAVGWVILEGFFFSSLYEKPRSVWRAGGEGRWRKGWRAEGRVCSSELLCVGAPRSALASRPVGRGHRSGGSSSAADGGGHWGGHGCGEGQGGSAGGEGSR